MINKNLTRRIYVDTQHDSFVQCVSPIISPFKVVKLGTKIAHFNLQKAQNLNKGFNIVAVKQRILVGHLERDFQIKNTQKTHEKTLSSSFLCVRLLSEVEILCLCGSLRQAEASTFDLGNLFLGSPKGYDCEYVLAKFQ